MLTGETQGKSTPSHEVSSKTPPKETKKVTPAETVKNWKSATTISKRAKGYNFARAVAIALHPSGDIAAVDKNDKPVDMWSSKIGSPRVYVFGADTKPKFVLNSTDSDEKPVGKLVAAQGVAVTQDGNYAIADGTKWVKIFDQNGKYLSEFSTLKNDDDDSVKVKPSCIAVTDNGDILVGDFIRELVTVHSGSDYHILHEVPVRSKPIHIASGSEGQIWVSSVEEDLWQAGKLTAFNYSGEELVTIYPEIYDEVTKPNGIACNPDGTIFVAVTAVDEKRKESKTSCGHIHQYGSDGKFIECFVKRVYNPQGMALYGKCMAVADTNAVLMYKGH